ncbi:glycosyltransferase family 2 protein [Endozoicomonas acroporae]|uniref:glycosyltransferase family 2 protein n=1 Tax=Endozoicomonas acroporae TaxID=1701104 RepID=UPI003D78F9CA
MKNLISIIIPMYNTEKYLSKCLDSIINQTYRNLQIICVNDGSSDNSLTIAQSYARKDSRLIVIDQTNQGVSRARNVGLSKATGDYIMFVDSDDWLDSDCCCIALKLALKKDYDVVFWPYNKIFSNRVEKQFIYNQDKEFENRSAVSKGVFKDLLGPSDADLNRPYVLDSKGTVHCKLYKSSLLKNPEIRFVDIKKIGTSEDLLFNLKVFNKVKSAYFLNTPLYNYLKTNEESITTGYKPDLLQQWNVLHKYIVNTVDLDSLGIHYMEAFSNRIACSIIGLGLNEMRKKGSFLSARAGVLGIISKEKYITALHKVPITNMPLHWKLFFILAKWRFVTPLTLLYLVIYRIILK